MLLPYKGECARGGEEGGEGGGGGGVEAGGEPMIFYTITYNNIQNRINERQMRPVHSNEEKEFSSGPNNYTQAASPKLNGGSGLKEIVRRDEKYKEKHVTMVSKTPSSPRSCEMVKEAFLARCKANSDATLGKYVGGSGSGLTSESLYVKNYKY